MKRKMYLAAGSGFEVHAAKSGTNTERAKILSKYFILSIIEIFF